MTPEEQADLLEAEAAKAKTLTSDAGTIVRRDLSDVAAGLRAAAGQRASANSNGFFGMRIRQCVPGSPGE